jgi:uncharacterized membrane protein YfcA
LQRFKLLIYFIFYLLIGFFVGFAAGLFGVGGGTTQVPLFLVIFKLQGFSEKHIMYLSLGTSIASIFFTSLSIIRAHNLKGTVRWDIFRRMGIGLLIGTFSGSFLLKVFFTTILKIIFVVIKYFASPQIMFDIKPCGHLKLPSVFGLFVARLIMGDISSLAAAGGGFFICSFYVTL